METKTLDGLRFLCDRIDKHIQNGGRVFSDHPGRSGEVTEVFGPFHGKLLVKILGTSTSVNPESIRFE